MLYILCKHIQIRLTNGNTRFNIALEFTNNRGFYYTSTSVIIILWSLIHFVVFGPS